MTYIADPYSLKLQLVKLPFIPHAPTQQPSPWAYYAVNDLCLLYLELLYTIVCIWGDPERAPH